MQQFQVTRRPSLNGLAYVITENSAIQNVLNVEIANRAKLVP